MQTNGFRFELRLGKQPEDTVRVTVSPDTLLRNPPAGSRRVLFDAAVNAFRARAHLAGHDAAAIEAEVDRFQTVIERTR
jgi:hypothetical protein